MRRVLFPLSIVCCVMASPAGAAIYTTFAVPDFKSTQAVAINDAGTVTGVGYDSNDKFHSFVRSADGTITVFDPPGMSGSQGIAIDKDGTIVGDTGDGSQYLGYLRAPDGTITTFSVPKSLAIFMQGIDGSVIGSGTRKRKGFAFIRSPHGKLETFEYPGALDTEPRALNRDGTVVGVYHNNTRGNARGFVRYPDGTFQDIDIGNHRVFPEAINEDGAITGAAQPNRGFIRSAAGVTRFIKIKNMLDILPSGITASGNVVGVCYDENFTEHGFVWSPENGATVFDVPGATRTWVNSVSPDGKITGTYLNQDGSGGSFVRTE